MKKSVENRDPTLAEVAQVAIAACAGLVYVISTATVFDLADRATPELHTLAVFSRGLSIIIWLLGLLFLNVRWGCCVRCNPAWVGMEDPVAGDVK